jgi:hypothetical protein
VIQIDGAGAGVYHLLAENLDELVLDADDFHVRNRLANAGDVHFFGLICIDYSLLHSLLRSLDHSVLLGYYFCIHSPCFLIFYSLGVLRCV